MKNIIKFIQTGLILLVLTVTSNAQVESKTQSISLGYVPLMALDAPTIGFHIGYNKSFSMTKRFTPELQASYSFGIFDDEVGFFKHGEGSLHIINILGGYRAYLTKREKKTTVYLNLLVGYAAVFDKVIKEEETRRDTEHDLGFSTGLYVETKNNISFGFSIETYAAAVFKVGHSF